MIRLIGRRCPIFWVYIFLYFVFFMHVISLINAPE